MSHSEEADVWIGRVIDGRYRVQAKVGTGGMGAVYRVEHVRMGKIAAMKVLHRELARHAGAVRRFRREVELVSRLDHPNIVQTFDCGYTDGQLYLVMEYVKGEDLSALVWRDGPLAVPRALALAIQVCSALEEAHERGVVHCDLKPDNIVCARRRGIEQAKVLDFGLARLREAPDGGEITQTALLGGTPSYMSPEQVRFEGLDARSDLYSLGATLYRLITGEAAFEASSPIEVMRRHLTDELVPPSVRAPALDLPDVVDAVVGRAMARRPEDRYGSAAEMRDDLQAAFNLIAGVTPRQPEAEWHTPVTLPDWVASSDDALARLEREDIDVFERRVRRRRLLGTFLMAPLVLGALALVGWAGRSLLPGGRANTEHEPNDRPALASPLTRGRPVRGHIGPTGSSGQPDCDYYRVAPGAGPRALTARISGVPDLDLVLELYDGRGQLVARANAAPAGEEERLGPVALGSGEAFLRVRPFWTAGELAGAGSLPYTLTADWGPPRPDWELEPNDTPERATVIDEPGPVNGTFSSYDDEDWFRVRVPPGSRLEGRVDGLDGVDLVVLIGDRHTRIDRGAAGEHESFSIAPAADGQVLVGIGQHAPGPVRARPRLDEPYTLKLRVRAQPPAVVAAKRS
jgi:tRNA A-37 threonylcarbamoyl transferase component Bud32